MKSALILLCLLLARSDAISEDALKVIVEKLPLEVEATENKLKTLRNEFVRDERKLLRKTLLVLDKMRKVKPNCATEQFEGAYAVLRSKEVVLSKCFDEITMISKNIIKELRFTINTLATNGRIELQKPKLCKQFSSKERAQSCHAAWKASIADFKNDLEDVLQKSQDDKIYMHYASCYTEGTNNLTSIFNAQHQFIVDHCIPKVTQVQGFLRNF